VLDADSAAHEVLRQPHIERAVRERWGTKVFGPDGRIDRASLGRIVFADPPLGSPEREHLQRLTHPEIGRLLKHQARQLAASGHRVAVLDVPLLVEAGWDRCCDKLVFVEAPRQVRLSRALARGWSEAEFAARENAQESLDLKRARADVVLDNSAAAEYTEAQVERFWRSLVG
jgi:dephospho-CoA kinase